jgi:hypothetical protein
MLMLSKGRREAAFYLLFSAKRLHISTMNKYPGRGKQHSTIEEGAFVEDYKMGIKAVS